MSTEVPVGPILIFDGDCGFCTTSAEFGHRRVGVEIVAWQFADIEAVGLTQDECMKAVQWVAADGTVRSGAAAVSAALRTGSRGWRVLGTAMSLPGVNWVAERIYRLIARYRYRLPGGTAACRLPQR